MGSSGHSSPGAQQLCAERTSAGGGAGHSLSRGLEGTGSSSRLPPGEVAQVEGQLGSALTSWERSRRGWCDCS